MVHHKCIQGGRDWLQLRLGVPTASEFHNIITPKDGKPTESKMRRTYMMKLLTERILGQPLASVSASSLQHGHDWEPKARAAYEMLTGVDVEEVGFCTTDDGTIGASPDGCIDGTHGLEIKDPERPEIHVGYLVNTSTLVEKYWVQTQGQLYVTKWEWTDLVSYFRGIDMVIVRVRPDPDFQAKLDAALKPFVNDLRLMIDLATDKGWIQPPAAEPKEWLSNEDAEAILASRV